MTQTAPPPGNLPASPNGNLPALPSDFSTGLEDFDTSDLRMPRLSIDHDKGVFVDSLSGLELPEIHIIPLGMVKQRVLWKPNIEEGESNPLCRSTDFHTGYPTTTMRDPLENFPWGAVGLRITDITPNSEGRLTLPCDACRLKEWKSHPDGKKTWCTEQHAIPLLYSEPGVKPYMTALFTTQRSSLRGSQTLFASIVRRQLPAFAVYAAVSLQSNQRGRNIYYTPLFKEIGLTDQSEWPVFSDTYRSVRSYLQQTPPLKDADGNFIDAAALAAENTIQGSYSVAPPQMQQSVQQFAPEPSPWDEPPPNAWPTQQDAWPAQQPVPPVQQTQQPWEPKSQTYAAQPAQQVQPQIQAPQTYGQPYGQQQPYQPQPQQQYQPAQPQQYPPQQYAQPGQQQYPPAQYQQPVPQQYPPAQQPTPQMAAPQQVAPQAPIQHDIAPPVSAAPVSSPVPQSAPPASVVQPSPTRKDEEDDEGLPF
jgi:hypothetical protein